MKRTRSSLLKGALLLGILLMLLCAAFPVSAAAKSGLVLEKGYYRYYVNGVTVKNKWVTVKGKKYYFKSNGNAAVGSYKVKSTYYVFDAKGRLCVGTKTRAVKIKGAYYQVTKAGKAKKGWDSKKVYCYAATGKRITNGWSTDKLYYLNASGQKMKGIRCFGVKKSGQSWITYELYAFDAASGLYNAALTKQLQAACVYEAPVVPLKALIGEPKRATYERGCYDGPAVGDERPYAGGDDGILEYETFTLTTYRAPDGSEFFMGVDPA